MSATLVRDLTTDSTRRAILNSPRLYLACELGWTQWTLGFATGLDAEPGRQTIAAFDLCARPSAGDITMAVSTQGDSALRIRTVTLILLCTLAGSAFGQTPTGLTLFGDSLTDTGNISELTFGLAPGSDYFDGRFSNGPVWAEVMAQQFGLASPTHSRGGGSNYAYGGAETGSGSDRIYFYWIPRLGRQVETYLDTNPTPGSGELFVVWGGANNLLASPTADPAAPVAHLSSHITALADAGASRFLVANLPRLGQTPNNVGTADATAYDNLAIQFNALLAAELATLESDLGVDIELLDVGRLFDQLLADSAAFGLTNVTDPARDGATNPDAYLFWDGVHPTRVAHEVLGRVAADQVAGVAGHGWNAGAQVGRFNTVVNWDAIGLPAGHWQATLVNDVSAAARTAEVLADATVDTVALAGPTGQMRLEIAAGVTLGAGSGIAVDSGGVVAGAGTVEGDLVNGGGVEPGLAGVGTLSVTGSYEQAAAGRLTLDMTASHADTLVVTDAATLDGNLTLNTIGGTLPTFGQSFTLMTAGGGLAGTFASIDGAGLGQIHGRDAVLAVAYGPNALTATVTVVGDANLDLRVSFADYQILQGAFGLPGTWTDADFNGDGLVDYSDFALLNANFGYDATLGGLAAVPAYQTQALATFDARHIPEPASAALLGLGGLLALRRRRPTRARPTGAGQTPGGRS